MALKFAIVREDPATELAVAERIGAKTALLVGSGGCTALAFHHERPATQVTLYDFNPDQLAHIDRRCEAIAAGRPESFVQDGDFERLFRLLATGFRDLVAPEIEDWFDGAPAASDWFASPYWPALCHSVFHDELLVAMFGPAAIQHARPGSYPGYFQRVFERGFRAEGARDNPYLQHIFLGRFRTVPPWMTAAPQRFDTVLGGIPDVEGLERFDLVHLSNIFDWSDSETVATWSRCLLALRPGSAIVMRQLNNQRPLNLPGFQFDTEWGDQLQRRDRSLFYERILVGIRV